MCKKTCYWYDCTCSNIATVYLSILALTFCEFFIRFNMFLCSWGNTEYLMKNWCKTILTCFIINRFLYDYIYIQTRNTNYHRLDYQSWIEYKIFNTLSHNELINCLTDGLTNWRTKRLVDNRCYIIPLATFSER